MTIAPRKEDHVSVSTACLELSEIAGMVADPRAGAISTFSGTTRDNHFGKKVVRLEYEGYVPMAELELKKICGQVRARWNVLRIALVHRLGVTAVGEASVIIAVSSVHRKDSLEAVEFAINTLKATVPIWKLEVYEGDSRVWKENAEWGPGGGCCRKMVPIEAGGNVQVPVEAGNGHAPEGHAHVGTSRTNSASSTTSASSTSTGCSDTTSSANSSSGDGGGDGGGGSSGGSGGGCCGSHA